MPRGEALVVLAALAAGVGCYQPTLEPCTVTCAGPDSPCPGATSCGIDGYCHAEGEPMCVERDAGIDAAVDAGDGGGDPLLAGCVLHLKMDEAIWTGTANEVRDACGNDDHGSAYGGATTAPGGVSGRAGAFTGADACVQIPSSSSLHAGSAFTISAWVRPTALDAVTAYGVISKRTDVAAAAEYSVFVWSGDRVYFDVGSDDDRFNGGESLVNDAWQQITVSYTGDTPRADIYVNGTLDLTGAESDSSITEAGADVYVGCLPVGSPTQGWVGLIDEVVMWNRALSAGEIAAWHAQTAP